MSATPHSLTGALDPARDPAAGLFRLDAPLRRIETDGVRRRLPSGPAATLGARVADFFADHPEGPALLVGALPFDPSHDDALFQPAQVCAPASAPVPTVIGLGGLAIEVPSAADYADAVARCIERLDADTAPGAEALRKVVLARSLRVDAPVAIDPRALAARLGRPHFALPPLLLTGHSGVGKSRLARSIAGYAGVPFTQLSAGGASDSRALAGTSRGWASAHPCLPLMVMRTHGVANPLLCVEEIDKAADSRHNGRISDVLLTMVEPATARQYYDECLQMPADLSAVSWVLTANHADRVDPLLLARCRVLQVPRPQPEHFGVIMAGLTEDVADEFGVAVSDLPELPGEVVEAMRSGFAAGELNARQLAALHRRALIAAARAEKLASN